MELQAIFLYNCDSVDNVLVEHMKSKFQRRYLVYNLSELPAEDGDHIIIALFKSSTVPECLSRFTYVVQIRITNEIIQAEKLNFSLNPPFLNTVLNTINGIIIGIEIRSKYLCDKVKAGRTINPADSIVYYNNIKQQCKTIVYWISFEYILFKIYLFQCCNATNVEIWLSAMIILSVR